MRTGRSSITGFTLIEVLISVVIGLLVISVASSFYSRTVRENQKNIDSAMLQETAFFTSHRISQYLRQAGYKGIEQAMIGGRLLPVRDKYDVFPPVDDDWQQGQYIRADAASVSIRFNGSSNAAGVADGTMIDCNGVPAAAGDIQRISIRLVNGSLVCRPGQVSLIGGDDDSPTVEQLKITLGVDDTNDGSVDRYVSSEAATFADMTATSEIFMRLLLVSPKELDAMGRKYSFNDIEYTYTDNRYRREVLVRIAMRNS